MSEFKIEKITVRVGETIPTGDYKNFRYDVELSTTLPPDKDHNEAHDYLQKEAEMLVKEKKNDVLRNMEGDEKIEVPTQVDVDW